MLKFALIWNARWPQDFFRDYFIDSDQVFKLKVGHPLALCSERYSLGAQTHLAGYAVVLYFAPMSVNATAVAWHA